MRWFDQSQPQTLQIAVILLYIRAVFALLSIAGGLGLLSLIIAVGGAASGLGIANSKRLGWIGGIIIAGLFLLFDAIQLLFVFGGTLEFGGFLGLVFWVIGVGFDIALLVALIHPQSRDYQKIWFE